MLKASLLYSYCSFVISFFVKNPTALRWLSPIRIFFYISHFFFLFPDSPFWTMGQYKKESARVARAREAGDDRATNIKVKGENFYRDAKKLRYINMLKGGKAIRNSQGKIIKAAEYQSSEAKTARVAPNRKWFGNTRVITQKALEQFRESLGARVNDPYQVLLRQNKLPMSLLQDPTKQSRMHILDTESFANTFGAKAQRKKPKISAGTMEELMARVDDVQGMLISILM